MLPQTMLLYAQGIGRRQAGNQQAEADDGSVVRLQNAAPSNDNLVVDSHVAQSILDIRNKIPFVAAAGADTARIDNRMSEQRACAGRSQRYRPVEIDHLSGKWRAIRNSRLGNPERQVCTATDQPSTPTSRQTLQRVYAGVWFRWPPREYPRDVACQHECVILGNLAASGSADRKRQVDPDPLTFRRQARPPGVVFPPIRPSL